MNIFGGKKIAELEKKVSGLEKLNSGKIRAIYKRAKMYYDSASTDRTRKDWRTTRQTPYDAIKTGLDNLIARSRMAYDNDPYFRGAINSIVNNIVCTGLRPTPTVMLNNGKKNEIINKALSEGWKRYNDEWDRRGMITFNESQRLALRTIALSGSELTNTVRADKPSLKLIPIAKQMIEPDRLESGRDYQYVTISDNRPHVQTLHGINVDEYGKAVSYWIKGIDKPIPAKNMHIAFIHERPEQHIGVPWGAPCLDSIWDIHQLNEDTLIKSRTLADIIWWMKSGTDPWRKDGDKDSDNNRIVEKLMFLETMEKPEVIKGDDTITESIKPLVKMILQGAFTGLGTSYMTVVKDMEDINFAASRNVSLEERRMYRAIQKWFAKSYCQSEWVDYVWWMVFTNQIPGLTVDRFLKNQHKYVQCWWKAEGWGWVDPLKDAMAEIKMKEAGLKSDREILAGRGIELEDHYRELQEQQELNKKYNIEQKSEQKPEPKNRKEE